jgi:hypothetical protein
MFALNSGLPKTVSVGMLRCPVNLADADLSTTLEMTVVEIPVPTQSHNPLRVVAWDVRGSRE